MSTKRFKKGDIVRITSDIKKLHETQHAPEIFAQAVAGKEVRVLCAYKDGSYDFEETKLMLDDSVLEYVGHPPRDRKRKASPSIDPIRIENENTEKWVAFTEDFPYEKKFYDVLLPSWEIVLGCWPNASKMNEVGVAKPRQFLPGACEVRLSAGFRFELPA